MKPLIIDLYCRMGGSTVGYQAAGFRVVGVDLEPQRGYPGDGFVQGDAIAALLEIKSAGDLAGTGRPVAIHAGPPCQDANTATMTNRKRGLVDDHQQLVPATRELLDVIGLPYVIEQPTSSRRGTIRRDLTLCMDTFRGDRPPPWVMKHRSFELSGFTVAQPVHRKHAGRVRGWRHGECFDGPYVAGYGNGGGKATAAELRHALGIDWMTDRFDLCEAIPPAYTEYIGAALLEQCQPGLTLLELEYDPADYRKCSTCQQPTGAGCVARSGRIVGGVPDGIRVLLPRPHVARERRAGR
jgi:hypothetical protein